ncbi:hypothetical protein D917_00945 [Trichinella nativa]|uniref:Uncharacterized protein n=1 Tax=Trichinella nativa TaxID=6335 RepID=A0A1Y3EX54_9BILA|nr:hypothetical protein D917_00945 [Trichinella nativa]
MALLSDLSVTSSIDDFHHTMSSQYSLCWEISVCFQLSIFTSISFQFNNHLSGPDTASFWMKDEFGTNLHKMLLQLI